MNKKKYITQLNKCCQLIVGLLIFSGCSTVDKKDEIVDLQRRRIHKLENALEQKSQLIQDMKVKKWVNLPVKAPEKIAFKPMMSQIKAKDYVGALKTSSQLKKKYPESSRLMKIRVKLFRIMGLKKQANSEINSFRKFRAQMNRKSIKK